MYKLVIGKTEKKIKEGGGERWCQTSDGGINGSKIFLGNMSVREREKKKRDMNVVKMRIGSRDKNKNSNTVCCCYAEKPYLNATWSVRMV